MGRRLDSVDRKRTIPRAEAWVTARELGGDQETKTPRAREFFAPRAKADAAEKRATGLAEG